MAQPGSGVTSFFRKDLGADENNIINHKYLSEAIADL
jgi:hypothetical protein